jgi:hypothetical protein
MAIQSSSGKPRKGSGASQREIKPSPASPTPSSEPQRGSLEWYEAVEKRADEAGEMLYEMVKDQLGKQAKAK